MKMKLDLKNPKLRKTLIIALPIVFALTTAVAIALLVKPEAPQPLPDGDQLEVSTTEPDVPVVVPPETDEPDPYSRGLAYKSNGDGSCTLTGVGSCTDKLITVPPANEDGEAVTKVANGAFAQNRSIEAVILPDTVMQIGDGAFDGCRSLERIEIGEANAMYAAEDGVLFNKAMTTLIAYPAGKGTGAYELPQSVKRIASGAFASCPYLDEIIFNGTKAEWKAVYIAPGNDALENVDIQFASEDK